jgi:hypothetical protein
MEYTHCIAFDVELEGHVKGGDLSRALRRFQLVLGSR